MREPDISNQAQQNQDKPGPAAPVRDRSGAIQGGEAAKPGQMDGDEDVSPSAPAKGDAVRQDAPEPPR
jgi:hypothetical protein